MLTEHGNNRLLFCSPATVLDVQKTDSTACVGRENSKDV